MSSNARIPFDNDSWRSPSDDERRVLGIEDDEDDYFRVSVQAAGDYLLARRGSEVTARAADGSSFTFSVATVAASLIDELKKRFDKIVRKARRLGAEEPRLVLHPERFREETDAYVDAAGRERTRRVRRRVVDAQFHAGRVRAGGWEFVAAVDPTPRGAIVRPVPGATLASDELAPFRNTTIGRCDHCRRVRVRKAVYVLRRTDVPVPDGAPDGAPGTLMQVGSSCLRDFTAGHDAVSAAEFSAAFGEAAESCWGGFGRGPAEWDLESVLACAHATVRSLDGLYVPTGKSRDTGWGDKPSTKSGTLYRLSTPLHGDARNLAEWRAAQPTAEDHEAARRTMWESAVEIARLERADALTDYKDALAVLLREGFVRGRHVGFACSLIPFADRAANRRREAARPRKTSRHVGAVKERITRDATVELIRAFENDYGTRRLVKLVDEEGNVMVWWTNTFPAFKDTRWEVREGARVSVTGTVKDHGTYNNTAQTILTRCVLRKVNES